MPAADIHRGETRIPANRPSPWGAFAYRDFRLLLSGLFVAQIGQWMQFTTLTYLVGVVLTKDAGNSALGLGLLGASRSIPVLLFSPIAGYVADRYSRRRTLFLTNVATASLALGLTIVSQMRGPWVLPVVLLIAGCLGAVQSFDSPARQSWISTLVPRALISNAIGLSSFARNMPLMVGPAIAGILIGTVGIYSAFMVQTVTQWAVVLAIVLMRPSPVSENPKASMMGEIVSGFRFVTQHAVLKWLMLVLIVTCFCVRPYTWLLAGFAAHVLHVDAKAYGLMLAVGGIGTVSGALTTAIYQSEHRGRIWFVSGIVVAAGLIALGFVQNFVGILIILTMMGWGTMSFTSSSNVLIQVLSPEDMRGRTMSLFTMVMVGLVPAGTFLLGWLGSATGLPMAYATGGVIAILLGTWVWIKHPSLRHV